MANEEQATAKENDHKKLGRELDLFYIDEEVGKGLPMLTPKGAAIRRELERFIIDEEIKRGYLHVKTPDIAKLELYIKSGHYPHYKDSMYAPIEIDDEKFMLRPMTCPHHFQLYLSKPRSYRELPMRIAELAQLYRYEQSGELMGLQRVRTFCLADAHIICASEEQAGEEISDALDLIEYTAKVFGLEQGKDYSYRLSLGDKANSEKYYKNDSAWEKSETLLRELLKKRRGPSTGAATTGGQFVEAKDEAAFYGPKIDIQMKNANGKEDTAFTVQYDFCMPDRFNLTYTGTDGAQKRAFVVHRSSIGAIERLMAFLIEHYAGAFPLWLSPVQVKVLPVSEKHVKYAKEICEQLRGAGRLQVPTMDRSAIRVELDDSAETLGKRIRNGKVEKVPYLLIVGDEEKKEQSVTAEGRAGKIGKMSVQAFIDRVREEIKTRALS
ncbi:MAG: threonine--tRNA ligase [bacterium]|nr:threonine--tRNA ligase [bacterium]